MSAMLDTLLTPAQRAACFDADYGAASSHQLDPRNDDSDIEELLSDRADGNIAAYAKWLLDSCEYADSVSGTEWLGRVEGLTMHRLRQADTAQVVHLSNTTRDPQLRLQCQSVLLDRWHDSDDFRELVDIERAKLAEAGNA